MHGEALRLITDAGRQLGDNAAWRLTLSPSSAADASHARASAARAPFAASCSRAWPASPIRARSAEQLLLAPQELRTADPSFATELYNGHFGLAGTAGRGRRSSRRSRSRRRRTGWARELYGFGWLRHLRAAGSELSREQAKALVQDFIALKRSHPSPRLAAGDRRPPGDLLAVQFGAGPRQRRAGSLRQLLARADLAASLSLGELSRRARRRAAPRRADGADLCRAVHRRAASGGRPLRAAVLQGARPADPARRRAYLAQPRRAGRAAARSPAAAAMLRGARPRRRRKS